MGRAPCCDKANVKRGPWSPEEDLKLKEYIEKHGTGGNWIALPQKAGLKRCGKSCRLRWLNYLRPNIKHGEFSEEEDRIICSLYVNIGSRWSIIAAQLPGRTDNDIKNYWNTKLKKKLMGLLPASHHQRVIKPPFPSPNQNQNPPQPPPSPSSSIYIDCFGSYYSTPETTTSFTCLDPIISLPPSDYARTNCTTAASISHPFYQNQESMVSVGVGGGVSPMQYNYHNQPIRDSMFMFGSEGSCSSSDGSCSQVSHGREIKKEEMGGYHSYYMSSTFDEHSNNKFMLGYNGINDCGENINQWTDAKCFSQTQIPLDYDLEDIKQLISVNSSSFNIDEIKGEEEKAMYYYYYC